MGVSTALRRAILGATLALATAASPSQAAENLTMWVRASGANAAQHLVDLWNTGHADKIALTVIPDNQVVSKLAIGVPRPVDLLLMVLERLGAKVDIDAGYVVATTPNGFIGGEVEFPKVTVGGTHTALMAAATAHGTSVIRNAAREPESQGSRRLSQQDGRAHSRRRQFDNRSDGRRQTQWRASFGAAGPYRGRHLCGPQCR